jgi:NDP-sugar pyrophosphorylase family protein
MTAEEEVGRVLKALWPSASGAIGDLLPRDVASLRGFYPRLQQFAGNHSRSLQGTIDSQAIVRGDVIAMGPGSIIEAGAVIHDSCRLIVGARCRVRAGAVLRDEIVAGDDCLIGAHSDLARAVLTGPKTELGHAIVFNDSIAGANTLLSAFIGTANTHLERGKEIAIRTRYGALPSGRTYFGALIGDEVRIGSNTTISPGTIVLPHLTIPPSAALLGIVDEERRDAMMRDFFDRWGYGV